MRGNLSNTSQFVYLHQAMQEVKVDKEPSNVGKIFFAYCCQHPELFPLIVLVWQHDTQLRIWCIMLDGFHLRCHFVVLVI